MKNIELPEEYNQARKLQRIGLVATLAISVIALALSTANSFYMFMTTVMLFFPFLLIHTAYLGIRLKVIYLTTGIYFKEQQPIKYYSAISTMLLAALLLFYAVYSKTHS